MLEFILMLLGLAFPNSNIHTASADHNGQIITQTVNSVDGDTGGETATIPKK